MGIQAMFEWHVNKIGFRQGWHAMLVQRVSMGANCSLLEPNHLPLSASPHWTCPWTTGPAWGWLWNPTCAPLLLVRWSVRGWDLAFTSSMPLSVMLMHSHKHGHLEQLKDRVPRDLQCCCGLMNWLNKLVIHMACLHLSYKRSPKMFGSIAYESVNLWQVFDGIKQLEVIKTQGVTQNNDHVPQMPRSHLEGQCQW